MSDSQQAAAPESGDPELDPEIAALLDFEPVPVQPRVNGWDAEAQRAFIAALAMNGSPRAAARAIGLAHGGAERLRTLDGSASFNDAWDQALALHAARRSGRLRTSVDRLRPPSPGAPARLDVNGNPQQPGQVLNEYDEWEDEASYLRRAEEAKDSIGNKLVRSRRLYLMSISPDPLKRAAFEILTELPVDWELAEKMEPQPFEPWTRTNAHEPDMVLTAESGWLAGEIGYGPDKKAQLRAAINADRAERGLPPLEAE